jgi:hypothetical protein
MPNLRSGVQWIPLMNVTAVALRIALFSLFIWLVDSKLELAKLFPKFVYADIIVYDRCHAYFA